MGSRQFSIPSVAFVLAQRLLPLHVPQNCITFIHEPSIACSTTDNGNEIAEANGEEQQQQDGVDNHEEDRTNVLDANAAPNVADANVADANVADANAAPNVALVRPSKEEDAPLVPWLPFPDVVPPLRQRCDAIPRDRRRRRRRRLVWAAERLVRGDTLALLSAARAPPIAHTDVVVVEDRAIRPQNVCEPMGDAHEPLAETPYCCWRRTCC